MQRRAFLFQTGLAIAWVLPASHMLLACGSDGGDDGGGRHVSGLGDDDGEDGRRLTFVSAPVHEHTHVLELSLAELGEPPREGINRVTSPTFGHTHRVLLTAADLAAIEAGEFVAKATTFERGHTHVFALVT